MIWNLAHEDSVRTTIRQLGGLKPPMLLKTTGRHPNDELIKIIVQYINEDINSLALSREQGDSFVSLVLIISKV